MARFAKTLLLARSIDFEVAMNDRGEYEQADTDRPDRQHGCILLDAGDSMALAGFAQPVPGLAAAF